VLQDENRSVLSKQSIQHTKDAIAEHRRAPASATADPKDATRQLIKKREKSTRKSRNIKHFSD